MRLLLWLLPLLLQSIGSTSPSVAGRQPVLATDGKVVALAVGRDDGVYFARSVDGGRTFEEPIRVARSVHLSLGMRRGPRIAIADSAIVITAIVGERGGGADGDLMAWRSTDGGRTWSTGVRVNDVATSAREGLHDLTAGADGLLAAAWLDLRGQGTRIYTSISRDHGRTWLPNRMAYASPSGSACQCCHPSIAISRTGEIAVMFRNEIRTPGAPADAAPLRDMYIVRGTADGPFQPAVKLGVDSWPLAACPMDGGDVAFGRNGELLTIWRREDGIFFDEPGQPEEQIGKGTNPVLALTAKRQYRAWMTGDGVVVRDGERVVGTFQGARWPVLLPMSNGSVLLAYEHDGQAFMHLVDEATTTSAAR